MCLLCVCVCVCRVCFWPREVWELIVSSLACYPRSARLGFAPFRSDWAVAAFVSEVTHLVSIEHRNCVDYVGVVVDGPAPGIVTEFMRGGDYLSRVAVVEREGRCWGGKGLATGVAVAARIGDRCLAGWKHRRIKLSASSAMVGSSGNPSVFSPAVSLQYPPPAIWLIPPPPFF